MAEIEFARVLAGALPFKDGNINDTFRGQVLLEGGVTKDAIIKDLDIRQLSNEVLTSVLARAAGLPIPDGYLGVVSEADLAVTKAPALQPGWRLVYVSVDVKVPNVTFRARGMTFAQEKELLRDIAGWGHLGDLYAFDAWIANVDRHPGNLLFGGKQEVWLIDHGHCFSGPQWQPGDLDPDGDYRNRLSEWLTNELTLDQKRQRSGEASRFATAIHAIDVTASAYNSRIANLLPDEDVVAVEAFLKGRVTNVPRKANVALGVPSLL
jgi:hypothetical protein